MDEVGSGMSNTTEGVGYFTLPIVFFTGACTEREAKRRRWIRSDGEADGVEGTSSDPVPPVSSSASFVRSTDA